MLAGGCHCGAIRYEAADQPERHSICHCVDCRRSSGAPMLAWAVYKEGEVRVTKGEPKWRASSENAMRSFCPACGAGLFYRSEKFLPGLIDVQSATLDEPDRIAAPSAQVQVAERIGWAGSIHELPAFERYPG